MRKYRLDVCKWICYKRYNRTRSTITKHIGDKKRVRRYNAVYKMWLQSSITKYDIDISIHKLKQDKRRNMSLVHYLVSDVNLYQSNDYYQYNNKCLSLEVSNTDHVHSDYIISVYYIRISVGWVSSISQVNSITKIGVLKYRSKASITWHILRSNYTISVGDVRWVDWHIWSSVMMNQSVNKMLIKRSGAHMLPYRYVDYVRGIIVISDTSKTDELVLGNGITFSKNY